MCELFISSLAVLVVALFFSGWLEGTLSKCWSQLWCRIKTGKGRGEGRRHSDERMCGESGVWRERGAAFCQSSVAEQVWLHASLGTVPTRRQCVASTDCSIERRTDSNRETKTQVRLWGVFETDWQMRFSFHLHMKWSGWSTGGWKTAGKNEEKG